MVANYIRKNQHLGICATVWLICSIDKTGENVNVKKKNNFNSVTSNELEAEQQENYFNLVTCWEEVRQKLVGN